MKLGQSYRDPKIFNNKYIVKQQLSSGSFGVVYLAFDKVTREEVAVKLEKEEGEDVCTLDREIIILKRIHGVEGVPKLFWHGLEQTYNVIVISLLGKDFGHYIKLYKRLSLKSSLQIAWQLLKILESVHARGVIHRDFKPENIMTGITDPGTIYLVDFGVSKLYLDSSQKHIPYREKKSFIGTTRYASIAAHQGRELGRKDDIESMFYVVIYLFKGYQLKYFSKLPWQNLQNIGTRDRTVVVGEVKQSTELSELCKEMPVQINDIMMYLRSLEFRSEPDYKKIIALIEKAAASLDITLDRQFEWTLKEKSSTPPKDQLKDSQRNVSPGNSFLKPPDRADVKHLSQVSIQGSMSSQLIKYQPSQLEQTSIKDKKSKKSKKSLRSTKKNPSAAVTVQQEIEYGAEPVSVPIIHLMKKHTIESTWGFKSNMEEYDDDSPKLAQKYHQLQCFRGRKIMNQYYFQ